MTETGRPTLLSLKRLLPLIVLLAGLGLFVGLGGHHYLSLDALAQNWHAWKAWVDAHRLMAGPLFILIYTAAVALSVPGASVLTVTGGLLFGWMMGAGLVLIGATCGATLIFLAARTALGEPLRARAGPWLKRLEAGFAKNAFSYLLLLRVVPVIPFFIINLVPAFLGVKLWMYVVTTFIGIIPGVLVYSSIGGGLGSVFDSGGKPDLSLFTKPEIIAPLVGLALLALIPIALKRWKGPIA